MVALLLGLVAAQQLFAVPGSSPMRQALQNAFHAPWFFAVTMLLCLIFRRLASVSRLVVVGGIALLIAAGTEWLQSFTPSRSASVADLLNNLVGAGFALAVSTLVLLPEPKRPGIARLLVAAGVMLAGAVYSFWPVVELYEHKRERQAMLPGLIDTQDPRLQNYVRTSQHSDLMVLGLEGTWPDYVGKKVIRVRFGNSEYPTLYVEDLGQAWHTYGALVFDIFVVGDDALGLVAAVQYEGSLGTSSYYEFTAEPGANRIRVPRNQLVPDGASGIKIRDLLLYTSRENAERSLLVGAIFMR